jgi:membrane-bound metal-dependent hydrolase YbcI (DUF457 family)
LKKEDHFLATLAISPYIYYFFIFKNLEYTILASFLTAFFSWIPDIDIKITKKIDKIKKRHKIIYFLLFPIFYLLKKVLKHRGLTHSLYIPLILIYLDYLIKDFLLSFFIKILYFSVILHVLEDSITKSGVPIAYPLRYKIRIPLFSTRSKKHSIIIKMCSIILIILFVLIINNKINFKNLL